MQTCNNNYLASPEATTKARTCDCPAGKMVIACSARVVTLYAADHVVLKSFGPTGPPPFTTCAARGIKLAPIPEYQGFESDSTYLE